MMLRLAVLILMTTGFYSCKKGSVCEDCGQANRAPVANAGPDQVISPLVNALLLNGRNSGDPDNNLVAYRWVRLSGPSHVMLTNGATSQAQVTGLVPGLYEFELRVTDAKGLSDTDSLTVSVVVPTAGNVNFYFPDPSGSMPPITMFFEPPATMVIVRISNFPDGRIGGIWSPGYAPRCPIATDYLAEPEMYTSFNLPGGIYTWTAETVANSFAGFPPLPAAFKAFMATRHFAQGTITVQPGETCLNVPVVF